MTKQLAQALKNCPPRIRPHMTTRNIISGEDPKLYDDLFVDLAEYFRPKIGLQWLDVKKLQDEIWQGLRLGSFTSRIIDSAQKKAISSLLLSTTDDHVRDYTHAGNGTMAEQGAVDWFNKPSAKKQLQKRLSKFNYSQETINAHAFLARIEPLTAIDKMKTHGEARQFAIRRQLEEQQQVLELERNGEEGTGTAAAGLEKKDTASREEEEVCTQPDIEDEDDNDNEEVTTQPGLADEEDDSDEAGRDDDAEHDQDEVT